MKYVGFSSVKFYDLGIYYKLTTKKWLDVDFKGDRLKAEKWNEYVRTMKHVTGIEIKDLGKEGFEIKVPALISVAVK